MNTTMPTPIFIFILPFMGYPEAGQTVLAHPPVAGISVPQEV